MPAQTVGALLDEAAAQWPDVPGLVVPDGRAWSFAELRTAAVQVAQSLLGQLEPGERVAVWSVNRPEWYLLQLGAALAGATLVTVNPAYRGRELEDVLRRSHSAAIFLADEYRDVDCAAVLEAVRDDLPDLREVVLLSDWDTFLSRGKACELPDVAPSAAAQIQFTSGTTGRPKGAVLPHRGIAANGSAGAQHWAVQRGEVWLNAMPMFHVAGSVINALGALAAGATQLLCAFEPRSVARLIERAQVHVACLAGTMWTMLLDQSDAELSSVRAAVAGGQAIPAELVRRVEAATGGRMSVLYGMTELCGTVTATALDDDDETRTETCGQALPGVQLRIVSGEVQVRGWLTMSGYFEDPDATNATLVEGWVRTGDLGSLDADGRLRLTGRSKEMIIRAGENIYPAEIETRLRAHPAVADVAVVGLPDPLYGETVAAALVLRPGVKTPTDDELGEWCRAELAPFKAPRRWLVVPSLPMTPSGKVQKFLVQEAFAESKPLRKLPGHGPAPSERPSGSDR